ncbi:MAG: hypothetical protein D6820_00765, partial [Lentisphaerae bacterium]
MIERKGTWVMQRNETMPSLSNVTLEISLKPFVDPREDAIRNIFTEVFRHWYSLLKYAETISVMFWIGDGSEIFEFRGDLDMAFEWGKWLGFANESYHVADEDDPHHESLVAWPRVYREDAPQFTYRKLKQLISVMKEVGAHLYPGKRIRAGATIDPGPEFVPSPFKYERHPEILWGEGHGEGGCGKNIDCTASFHADQEAYAGFPNGIPEGTSFGTFLGRQARLFMEALDFDYIWFSNSFGFGRCPYGFGAYGEFFDGTRFRHEGNRECAQHVMQFWYDFRHECPEHMIETRGTDFPVGLDLVNHATPYRELYEHAAQLRFVPPPNTPWSALTGNYGLAMAGYMSRIAAWPGAFPYRYYTSDPWWCNTPWLDRYERSPHDIYLNLAIAKIEADGTVSTPNRLSLLSIDDSWGHLPEELPDETIPHLKEAFATRPDAASPFIWIYPFAEYHQWTFEKCARIGEVYAGDLLIQEAINCGLPLDTVISSEAFCRLFEAGMNVIKPGTVLVCPFPDEGSDLAAALGNALETGCHLLLYGPSRFGCRRFRELLGIEPVAGELDGEFEVVGDGVVDRFVTGTVSG